MRVQVRREVIEGNSDDINAWRLCFQWCLYAYDDGTSEFGYRFIWRHPISEGGGLQPARGQARIPSIRRARALMDRAFNEGWGDYDADQMEGINL